MGLALLVATSVKAMPTDEAAAAAVAGSCRGDSAMAPGVQFFFWRRPSDTAATELSNTEPHVWVFLSSFVTNDSRHFLQVMMSPLSDNDAAAAAGLKGFVFLLPAA